MVWLVVVLQYYNLQRNSSEQLAASAHRTPSNHSSHLSLMATVHHYLDEIDAILSPPSIHWTYVSKQA
jgi:hypothetical protein